MLVSFYYIFDVKEHTFKESSVFVAKKYTSDHEWISVDNGVGTFGVTDYAQSALGDVVFVETPAVGDVVAAEGKTKIKT